MVSVFSCKLSTLVSLDEVSVFNQEEAERMFTSQTSGNFSYSSWCARLIVVPPFRNIRYLQLYFLYFAPDKMCPNSEIAFSRCKLFSKFPQWYWYSHLSQHLQEIGMHNLESLPNPCIFTPCDLSEGSVSSFSIRISNFRDNAGLSAQGAVSELLSYTTRWRNKMIFQLQEARNI